APAHHHPGLEARGRGERGPGLRQQQPHHAGQQRDALLHRPVLLSPPIAAVAAPEIFGLYDETPGPATAGSAQPPGRIPSCWNRVRVSAETQRSTILPPAKRRKSLPVHVACLPLAATPNSSPPVWV